MFCAKCGELLPDRVKFCPRCGWQVPQEEPQRDHELGEEVKKNTVDVPSQSTVPVSATKKKGNIKGVIYLLVLVAAIVFVIYSIQNHPARDLKDIVFDNYGTATLGDAVEETMRNVKWSTDKISKTHYQVTVEGFIPEEYANVSLIFDLNYSDEKVYSNLDHMIWDGQYHDDIVSLNYAMATIYGD